MAASELPTNGFGFSWVLPFGKDLLTKSVAPAFLFVDYGSFLNTNISHRLNKRMIDAFVSINAPYWLLASLYGWDEALSKLESNEGGARDQACDFVERAMDDAARGGAEAIVLCDDLCGAVGPVPDPLFVVEHVLPLYAGFVEKARSLSMPIIFHADGDIREYYPYLAHAGFDAVHVAHPSYDQTRELCAAVREAGMLPFGGFVGARVERDGIDELVAFVRRLLSEGPLVVCDDGALKTKEQLAKVIEAMRLCRDAPSGGDAPEGRSGTGHAGMGDESVGDGEASEGSDD
jgi:hypothetical protein